MTRHDDLSESLFSRAHAVLDRRSFLVGAAASLAALAWPAGARAQSASKLDQALATSYVVYVTPLKSDGSESTCHGEVWFVTDGQDVLVVTAADRWRAAAIGKGLDRARLWAGEHGIWKRAAKAWEKSPSTDARASLDADPAVHARALARFGEKYASEWGKWGPRFEKGLASGERVLIRYTPDRA